jgi:hypothetical protein
MRTVHPVLPSLLVMSFLCVGCLVTRPGGLPISYLAVDRPQGVIQPVEHSPVVQYIPRGGWYFVNYNFRPAPDVAAYVEQAAQQANTKVLRRADVELVIPVVFFGGLLFGFNYSTDRVTAEGR